MDYLVQDSILHLIDFQSLRMFWLLLALSFPLFVVRIVSHRFWGLHRRSCSRNNYRYLSWDSCYSHAR